MKLVSWNVNGIRAAIKKNFRQFVEDETPNVLCLQETKANEDQVDLDWVHAMGYQTVWNGAEKKGYSGTAIWSRAPLVNQSIGLGIAEHDTEGRVVTVEFAEFFLINVYTPNAQRGLTRLDYRMTWDKAFLQYVVGLDKKKPVIFCGDLNCAHKEIDLANPKPNRKNAGFTPEECLALDEMESAGFVDTFRRFDNSPGQYSWWTYRMNARSRNVGWRLDYFWVSERFMDRISSASILTSVMGSDHCPVQITISD